MTIVVIGAGPGLGLGVARAFGRRGPARCCSPPAPPRWCPCPCWRRPARRWPRCATGLAAHPALAGHGVYVGTVTVATVVRPGGEGDPDRIGEIYHDMVTRRDRAETVVGDLGRLRPPQPAAATSASSASVRPRSRAASPGS
jgi:NAD(P)-dependent dehydrogenase (short-subunit alcohol dehydrogenase family)